MENYLGEIRAFAANKIPAGWLACNGQTLSVKDEKNQALYSLISTLYGGDGINTFKLPDMRGRAMVGVGKYITGPHPNDYIYYNWGEQKGSEGIVLTAGEVSSHTHDFFVSDWKGNSVLDPDKPGVECIAARPQVPQIDNEDIWVFIPPAASRATVHLNDGTISTVGGRAHENRMPYMPVLLCIATTGTYPSRP
jgi:microcystin-dependent protein